MADSTFTVTGLDALKASVDRLPDRVTAALKTIAGATAARVQSNARDRLATMGPPPKYAHPHGNAAIADGISIVDDAANKQFIVTSQPPSGAPANLLIWYEHGTIKQPARPYMAPAARAAEQVYLSEMEAAALAPVREALER